MAVTTATWSSPLGWTANLAATVARMNNYIGTGPTGNGGNMQWLYDYVNYAFNGRVFAHLHYPAAGNYTVNNTHTTFVTVDQTNLIFTQTINTGRVHGFWRFRCTYDDTSHVGFAWISTYLDLATVMDTDNNAVVMLPASTSNAQVVVPFMFTGLNVGSHTFTPIWRTSGATGALATIFSSATEEVYGEIVEE